MSDVTSSYYSPGSKSLAPAPPFQFIEEDKEGASPKLKVKDEARNSAANL
jgi:hypothetical protein